MKGVEAAIVARARSSLSETERPVRPTEVAGSTSRMSPSFSAGRKTATAGVARSPAAISIREGPRWRFSRGMSVTIGGTCGPMSAGSVSSGG